MSVVAQKTVEHVVGWFSFKYITNLQKSSIFVGRFLNSVLPITLKERNNVGGTIGR
jgi:hypothetical protein